MEDQSNKMSNSGLNKLKKELNSKYTPAQLGDPERAKMHQQFIDAKSDWVQKPLPPADPTIAPRRKLSFLRVFFFLALFFFLGASGYALYTWQQGANVVSTDKVALSIDAPTQVDGGDELEMTVTLANGNAVTLDSLELIVTVPNPDGVSEPLVRKLITLDSVDPGNSTSTDISFSIFGQQGLVYPVNVLAQYSVSGSGALFTSQTVHEVVLASTLVAVDLTGPDTIVPGEDVEFIAKVTSQAEVPLRNVGVIIDYPSGFEFDQSSPLPDVSDHVWFLPTLSPEEEVIITISGRALGVAGAARTWRVQVGNVNERNNRKLDTVLTAGSKTVQYVAPFLQSKIFVNGQSNSKALVSRDGEVTVEITNAGDTALKDVLVTAQLAGQVFDRGSVSTRGRFEPENDSIIWESFDISNLEEILPGETVDLEFEFSVISRQALATQSPSGTLVVTATGVNALTGQQLSTETIGRAEVLVPTEAQMTLQTLSAAGPNPPEVGQTSVYNLGWTLRNSTNDLEDIVIRTKLPRYVQWRNQIAPGTADISYNDVSREVVWRIDRVPAGTGYGGPVMQALFQVSVTPSAGQLGDELDLTDDNRFTSIDIITTAEISDRLGSHTTQEVVEAAVVEDQ